MIHKIKSELIMKKYKKVTYTLEKELISKIAKKSRLKRISESKFVSIFLESSFEFLMEEYYRTNQEPMLDAPKKRFNTFAKTYSLPIDVENKLTWFSDKFLLKKSHLIRACYIYYIYKEEEKKNKEIQEKMHSIIPLYVEHVKLMRNKTT